MLSIFKTKLILFIAKGEPVLLNWNINSSLIKDGKLAVYYPPKNHNLTREGLFNKAVLTPLNSFQRTSQCRRRQTAPDLTVRRHK